jgi:hypothetical protein
MLKLSSEHEQQIEMMFSSLRASYALTLPTEISELELAVQRAKKQPDNKVFLQYAYLQLHRLGGTIGSYGFTELGELIKEMELKLKNIEAYVHDKFDVREQWRQIDPLVKKNFAEAKSLADKHASMDKSYF